MDEVISEGWNKNDWDKDLFEKFGPPPEINAICHHCYKKIKVRSYFFGPASWICSECVKKAMDN